MEPLATSFYCRACGYCLDHLDSHRCPECSREFDRARLKTMSRSPRTPSTRFVGKLLLGITVFLTVVYFIAYALCVQIEKPRMILLGFGPSSSAVPGWPRSATYAVGGVWAQRAFAPANWIDRHVRRDHWEYYGVAEGDIAIHKTIRRGMQLGKPLNLSAAELMDELQRRDMMNPNSPQYRIQLAKIRQLELELNAACDHWEATH